MLVAVYGTLLRGLGNHRRIENAEFVGEAVTAQNYDMFADYLAFPWISLEHAEDGTPIKVELYEVDDNILADLDQLEGYHGLFNDANFYDRSEVEVVQDGEVKNAIIYHIDRAGQMPVEGGSWRGHLQSR